MPEPTRRVREDVSSKPRAAPLPRSASPQRANTSGTGLLNRNPGPNAFAMREEETNRQRLRGNAFFQEEHARRNATPPTAIHPLLRGRLEESSSPIDALSKYALDRVSQVTTFSPFISQGNGETFHRPASSPSEPLDLIPESAENAIPTHRGVIEEKREQSQWNASGITDERTPVYMPTPKLAFEEPSWRRKSADKRADHERSASPRRGFLDRLNTSLGFRSSTNVNQIPSPTVSVPPKAAATLGTSSPSKGLSLNLLTRSPSKKKGPGNQSRQSDFTDASSSTPTSVKQYEYVNDRIYPVPAGLTTRSRNNDSYSRPTTEAKRIVSDTHISPPPRSQQEQSGDGGVTRSKSLRDTERVHESHVDRNGLLKYYDKQSPPTPPTKDTPPEVKAMLDGMPHHRRNNTIADESPSKRGIRLSADAYLGPEHAGSTKDGGVAYREAPHVVEKMGSVQSMYGAVVDLGGAMKEVMETKMMEPSTPEGKMSGLLDNGQLPQTVYKSMSYQVYSPSVYNAAFGPSPDRESGWKSGESYTRPSLPRCNPTSPTTSRGNNDSSNHSTSNNSPNSAGVSSTSGSIPVRLDLSPHAAAATAVFHSNNDNDNGNGPASPKRVTFQSPPPDQLALKHRFSRSDVGAGAIGTEAIGDEYRHLIDKLTPFSTSPRAERHARRRTTLRERFESGSCSGDSREESDGGGFFRHGSAVPSPLHLGGMGGVRDVGGDWQGRAGQPTPTSTFMVAELGHEMGVAMDKLDDRIGEMGKSVGGINAKVGALCDDVNALIDSSRRTSEGISKLDERIDGVEAKVDGVNYMGSKINFNVEQTTTLALTIQEVGRKLDKLGEMEKRMVKRMDAIEETMDAKMDDIGEKFGQKMDQMLNDFGERFAARVEAAMASFEVQGKQQRLEMVQRDAVGVRNTRRRDDGDSEPDKRGSINGDPVKRSFGGRSGRGGRGGL